MADDNSSIAFSIYHGGKLTREVSFDRAIINIGKLSTSNLRLNDVNSSRKHAVVERLEDGSWRATDLGSTNGTSLNGKRMTLECLFFLGAQPSTRCAAMTTSWSTPNTVKSPWCSAGTAGP